MFRVHQRPPGRPRRDAHPAHASPPITAVGDLIARLRLNLRGVARRLADPDGDDLVRTLNAYERLRAYGAAFKPEAEALIVRELGRLASPDAC